MDSLLAVNVLTITKQTEMLMLSYVCVRVRACERDQRLVLYFCYDSDTHIIFHFWKEKGAVWL